jgi:hypothetical protein
LNHITNSNYNGQSNSDEKLITTTSPNLVSNFIIGCGGISITHPSKTSMMFKSSETLARLNPIEVSGEDFELASNLQTVSEDPFSKNKNVLRMEMLNSE